MLIRVGINGFGRIGRAVFRLAHAYFPQIEIAAINDRAPLPQLAYLLKYDSVHGPFSQEIAVGDRGWAIGSQETRVFREEDPAHIPWDEARIDFVIESTGLFTHSEDAKGHCRSGVKCVVISAPSRGEVPTYIMGINHHRYDPRRDKVISSASCTTHCLAPMMRVLLDHFGVERGFVTTVHAMTSTQPVLDTSAKRELRGSRAATLNIIPASTGAIHALSLSMPEMAGKLAGMAFRVPVTDVSVVDLTVELTKSTDYATICRVMRSEAEENLKGILSYTEEEVVSSDLVGSRSSSIFDRCAGIELSGDFFKLVSWYDNETGYACRLLDLISYMAEQM